MGIESPSAISRVIGPGFATGQHDDDSEPRADVTDL